MKVHSSGNFIAWPGVKMFFKPEVDVLVHYKNDDRATQQVNAYICLRPILPMKVHNSPLLAILLDDETEQWKPRFSVSTYVVKKLQQILRCYTTIEVIPFYRVKKDLCDQTWEKVKTRTDELELALMQRIHENPGDFRQLIQQHTIDYINLLEECCYDLFQPQVPLKNCLTPFIDCNKITLDPEAEKKFKEQFKIFFASKQRYAGVKAFTFKRSIYKDYLEFFELEKC